MRKLQENLSGSSGMESAFAIPGEQQRKLNQLWMMCASHPVLKIRYQLDGKVRTILASVCHNGYTGNMKDRLALYVFQKAYHLGYLSAGSHIVVAGSDPMAVSFSAMGRYLGHAVSMIIPEKLPMERQYALRGLGAHLIPSACNGRDFELCREVARSVARVDTNTFLPHEHFGDERVQAHLYHTVPEIFRSLMKQKTIPDVFTGLSRQGDFYLALREFSREKLGSDLPVVPLMLKEIPDPEFLYGGLVPSLSTGADVHPEFYNQPMKAVCYGDAQLLARRLSDEAGLSCGPVSAGNLLGAMETATERGADQQVFTILPDTRRQNLQHTQVPEISVRSHYRSPYIKLMECTTLRRRAH